jgi:hypothetical protein
MPAQFVRRRASAAAASRSTATPLGPPPRVQCGRQRPPPLGSTVSSALGRIEAAQVQPERPQDRSSVGDLSGRI